VDVSHTLRELVQSQTYQQDNQDFLEGFMNEVKPYHVVIKEFSVRYTATDEMTHVISDFDLPALYDSSLGRFITPNLNFKNPIGVSEFSPDADIWNNLQYFDWVENYGLSLTGISNYAVANLVKYVSAAATTIQIDNAHGIPLTGTIKINDELISYASVDRDAGLLSTITRGVNGTEVVTHNPQSVIYMDLPGIVVLDSGRDYIDPPEITVYIDTNQYPTPNRVAKLKPIMSGDKLIGIVVTDTGSGYAVIPDIIIEPVVSATFDSTDINFVLNTITISSVALKTGDVIKFTAGNGSTVLGLEDQKHYYVGVIFTDSEFGLTSTVALYTTIVSLLLT
jgi:hypothetical protein